VIFDAVVSPFSENAFMARALLAGVLVAVSCAVVGAFVVLRGLAFIGDALAHGVLPGVAIATLFGIPGMVGAAAGSLAMIAGVGLVTRRSNLSSDTAVGLLFVGMLSLGVAIVSRSRAFTGDLVHLLFGEILGISAAELGIQAAALVLVALVAVICRRPFLLLCFDRDQADAAGFDSRRYHGIMLGLIAITVVVSFRTVGTLLVFGMLLAPAACAMLFARTIGTLIAVAAGVGSLAVYVGLLVSYHANLAAGASITLMATLFFFAALTVKGLLATVRAVAPERVA
jgi:ABC-type Mn2+/Zn2+ transport system permease subunit